MWQTQIQTIEYGFDDMKHKKEPSYIDTLLIYTLWYEFSNDLDAESDFGKISVTNNLTWTILILSML